MFAFSARGFHENLGTSRYHGTCDQMTLSHRWDDNKLSKLCNCRSVARLAQDVSWYEFQARTKCCSWNLVSLMERCISAATPKLNAGLVLKAASVSAAVESFSSRSIIINRTETGRLLIPQSEVPETGGFVPTLKPPPPKAEDPVSRVRSINPLLQEAAQGP